MKCYACTEEAKSQCGRCGRPYCEDHGDAFCGECLKPASALPSFTLYRGSLLALLVGTALAVWLIVRPPGDSEESSPGVALPGVLLGQESPTPVPSPILTGTPAAGITPTPQVTPTPAEVQEYTVQEGDTLYSIAELYLPPGEELVDFVARLAELNELGDPEEVILHPGQVLRVSPSAAVPPGASSEQRSTTPTPAGTAVPTSSPAPEATPTATEVRAHIVQEGDTLYGIAELYLPPGEGLGDFVVRLARFNELGDPEEVILRPGQVLRIPP